MRLEPRLARQAPSMGAILVRWLPAAIATGAAAAIALGGVAFLLALPAG